MRKSECGMGKWEGRKVGRGKSECGMRNSEVGMGIVCTKLSNCRVADPPCMIKIEDERIHSLFIG